MNILIINQPPFNRGDESAHKGLLRTLIKHIPGVHIRVMSPLGNAESMRQYGKGVEGVEYIAQPELFLMGTMFEWQGMHKGRTWLWHFHPVFKLYKRIYKWADIVMCAPGGICMGGFQDWNHLFCLKLAKYFKRPLVYYGRSFGPFPTETESNRQFKKVSMEMLNYFSFLSIRDKKTEKLSQELGISYTPTVDSAFLDAPEVDIPWELRQAIGGKPYMVFVPNYLRWHYAYKDINHDVVINFYKKVIEKIWEGSPDLNIVMLPQLFCGSSYPVSDVDFFRELSEQMGDSRMIVAADCYSSDIQQSIIKDAEFLIGARYHSIVFAINQNTPFIALSYEHKIAGLLASLGKEDCCIDFTETLRSAVMQDQVLSQIGDLMKTIKKDEEARQKAKSIAKGCMDKFLSEFIK